MINMEEEYKCLERVKLIVDLKIINKVLEDYKIDVTELAEIISKYRELANKK